MHPEEEKKLRQKYAVRKVLPTADLPEATSWEKLGPIMFATDPENIDSPFVLMPRKDPAAFAAMIYYAQMCEPKLAVEIADFLAKIAAAEPKFGTQGIRNYTTTRTAAIQQI